MKKIQMFAMQNLDRDNWVMSGMDGKLVSYMGTFGEICTKKYIEARGYKIGKKLKEQRYSDWTMYLLTPSPKKGKKK